MTIHSVRFERHRQSVISRRGKFETRFLSTATTTCTCGLNTDTVPAEEAGRIAETHADAVGLPDPLRPLRHFLLGVR
jgi:hypothetical protein